MLSLKKVENVITWQVVLIEYNDAVRYVISK